MQDNTTKEVTYNYAAKVQQIKRGELVAKSSNVKAFCDRVKYVMFDTDKHSNFQTRFEQFKRDHRLANRVSEQEQPVQTWLPYKD